MTTKMGMDPDYDDDDVVETNEFLINSIVNADDHHGILGWFRRKSLTVEQLQEMREEIRLRNMQDRN